MMTKWMLAAGAAMVLATPAAAQSGLEGRVGKLESEMRAVQRKVFPGGAGATVAPEIAPVTSPVTPDGTPATTPIADLTGRVASLEQQIAGVTGQVEQAQYRLRQLEEQFAAYRTATDAKLAAAPAAAAAASIEPAVTVPTAPRPAAGSPRADAEAEAATGLTAGGAGGVTKPSTGDAAEDEYTYGFRLWQAKRYGEAATQLKKVATTYPKHRRATFAQNLLGRTYLDDNKPSLASIAFYDNYKKYPDRERAPESLYYLGSALLKLDKPADACKVYGELLDVYGDKITPAMKTSVGRARTSAKCS